MLSVKDIYVRRILNSNGEYALEAEVTLHGGERGRASAAAAIMPGRREVGVTANISEKISKYNEEVKILTNHAYTQETWDREIQEYQNIWGSDLVLSLSLAFARAAAKTESLDLVTYIQNCGNIQKGKPNFSTLVPFFSGGVHDICWKGSMQQIMLTFQKGSFSETVDIILQCYAYVENVLKKSGNLMAYSASSGFLSPELGVEEQLNLLSEAIEKLHISKYVSIALDVAAEHLRTNDGYYFYGETINAETLKNILLDWTGKYPISYIEDPFDAKDISAWTEFYEDCGNRLKLFSDDLSATQSKFLTPSMTHGIIVKMKQVGNLTQTLETVKVANKNHLMTCVSHRSYETEDTFMCDLGVAIGTDYMKIGGPRRGDRVEKYNQLLRICNS